MDEMRSVDGQLSYHVLERRAVEFSCTMYKRSLNDTLVSIGKEGIADLITDGKAEMSAIFCNEHYEFTLEELQQIYENVGK